MGETWTWEGGDPSGCPLEAFRSAEGFVVTHDGPQRWSLEARSVMLAWSRWCALTAVPLWDCPRVVLCWLQTGDPTVRLAARAAARAAAKRSRPPAKLAASAAAASAIAPHACPTWAALEGATLGARALRRPPAILAPWLVLMLHAEHELQQLDPPYRELQRGNAEDRAVLRDIALSRGLAYLVALLSAQCSTITPPPIR